MTHDPSTPDAEAADPDPADGTVTRSALMTEADLRRLVTARLVDMLPRELPVLVAAVGLIAWSLAEWSGGPASVVWATSAVTLVVVIALVVVRFRRTSAAVVAVGHTRTLVVAPDAVTLVQDGEVRARCTWQTFRTVRRVRGHLVLPLRQSRSLRWILPAALVDAEVERLVRARVASAATAVRPMEAYLPPAAPEGADPERTISVAMDEPRMRRLATDTAAGTLLRPWWLTVVAVYLVAALLLLAATRSVWPALLGVVLVGALWQSMRRQVLRSLAAAGPWQTVSFDDAGFSTTASTGAGRFTPEQLRAVRVVRSAVLLRGRNGVVMVFPRELFPDAELDRLTAAVAAADTRRRPGAA